MVDVEDETAPDANENAKEKSSQNDSIQSTEQSFAQLMKQG